MPRRCVVALIAGLSSALASTAAIGTPFVIDWLTYEPYLMNDFTGPQPSLPPGQIFNLPGVGDVRMDYTTPPVSMSGYRFNSPDFITGWVTSGGSSYSWNNHEALARTNFDFQGNIDVWSVTYTFLDGPVPAGSIALGVQGLGRLDLNYPGNITTACVSQNGTYLGEWGMAPNFGPNQFSNESGSFCLQNALPGNTTPGNPAFNTRLGIVRIDDTISSLTVSFNQIGQDGIGVNIGLIPAPGAAALLGLGAHLVSRRRRV